MTTIFEIYDLARVATMGRDEGYMGFVQTRSAAEQYIIEFRHLFEGEPSIVEVTYA